MSTLPAHAAHSASAAMRPPRALDMSAIALILACSSLALAPARDALGGAQCACAVLATLLSLGADRGRRRTSAAWALLACLALLASASAAVARMLLARPDAVHLAGSALACLAGAFAFAAALYGTSRALQSLGAP